MGSPALDLVIFDLDGVLVDTSPCHAEAYARLWRRLGVDAPAYESIAGRKTRDVVAEITRNLDPDAARLETWVGCKQAWAREAIARANIVFDDAPPLLAALQEAGVALAVGTSASAETAALAIARVGEAYFPIVVTSADVTRGKPSPEIYHAVLQRAGIPAGRSLVVEDSQSGLLAALSAGAYAVSVRGTASCSDERFLGRFADLESLGRWMGLEA